MIVLKMRKRIISSISFLTYFPFLAAYAYAQNTNSINPCPNSTSFGNLCNVAGGDIAVVVRTIVIALLAVAVVIGLIFLIWGGIKWVLSGGDKSAVEAARNTIVASIIGLAVAFAAFFILVFVGKVFNVDVLNISFPTF